MSLGLMGPVPAGVEGVDGVEGVVGRARRLSPVSCVERDGVLLDSNPSEGLLDASELPRLGGSALVGGGEEVAGREVEAEEVGGF